MITKVHTKIYVIKQSNKGWSEPFAVFFDKAKADAKLAELLAIPKSARNNFRLETWNCEDSIIYNVQ